MNGRSETLRIGVGITGMVVARRYYQIGVEIQQEVSSIVASFF